MSKPAFKYRGVMLDFARLTEQHDYYRNLLPWLKKWGYNLLHVHFTDDQGCALKFPSHPELATPHAYTPEEMREFCAEARRHGLEVVPEIECWGHTDFITRVKKYRHLREIDEGPGRFSGMCVFEPDAKKVLKDLLRDTVEIFEPRLVHAGLDEVNFGHHPLSKKLLKKKKANRLFADHIVWCHKVITGLGPRMAIWGDHLLHDREEAVMARRTPKDTIIFDWHYQHDYEPWTLDFFMDHGFEIYGAPAIQRYRNRVISSWENFENLRRFTGYALQRRTGRRGKGKVTGMVNTVWCPYRYVPGTIEYPLAVAGALFTSEGLESPDFPVHFAREFWGVKGHAAEDLGLATEMLYLVSPTSQEYDRVLFGCELRNRSVTFSRADQFFCRERQHVVVEAGKILKGNLASVKRNAGRLKDLIVAAEFLKRLYAFGASARKKQPNWKSLQKLMQQSWARSRYCDGRAYTKKAGSMASGRGDRDAVMRHVNGLAKE